MGRRSRAMPALVKTGTGIHEHRSLPMSSAAPMRREDVTDLVVAGVIVAFACLALFVLIPAGIEHPGSIDVMALGPAFWPSVISGFLGLMGLIVGVQALRRVRAARDGSGSGRSGPDETDAAEAEAAGFAPMRWLAALALLALYYFGLDRLGMVLTSMLALGLFMVLGGERRPAVVLVLSLGVPLALFLFFRFVANVFIPLGVFESWLG